MEALELFLEEKRKTAKEETCILYRRELLSIQNALSPRPLEKAEERDLVAYFSRASRRLSFRSLIRRFSVATGYFRFLQECGRRADDPTAQIRILDFRGKKEPLLKEEDVLCLFTSSLDALRHRRDEAMLLLLCAARVPLPTQLTLTRKDLDLSAGCVFTNKQTYHIPEPVRSRLQTYLAAAPGREEDFLFPGNGGKALTRQSVWRRIRERAIFCGIDKNVSPRTLLRFLSVHSIPWEKVEAQWARKNIL